MAIDYPKLLKIMVRQYGLDNGRAITDFRRDPEDGITDEEWAELERLDDELFPLIGRRRPKDGL